MVCLRSWYLNFKPQRIRVNALGLLGIFRQGKQILRMIRYVLMPLSRWSYLIQIAPLSFSPITTTKSYKGIRARSLLSSSGIATRYGIKHVSDVSIDYVSRTSLRSLTLIGAIKLLRMRIVSSLLGPRWLQLVSCLGNHHGHISIPFLTFSKAEILHSSCTILIRIRLR